MLKKSIYFLIITSITGSEADFFTFDIEQHTKAFIRARIAGNEKDKREHHSIICSLKEIQEKIRQETANPHPDLPRNIPLKEAIHANIEEFCKKKLSDTYKNSLNKKPK